MCKKPDEEDHDRDRATDQIEMQVFDGDRLAALVKWVRQSQSLASPTGEEKNPSA